MKHLVSRLTHPLSCHNCSKFCFEPVKLMGKLLYLVWVNCQCVQIKIILAIGVHSINIQCQLLPMISKLIQLWQMDIEFPLYPNSKVLIEVAYLMHGSGQLHIPSSSVQQITQAEIQTGNSYYACGVEFCCSQLGSYKILLILPLFQNSVTFSQYS